MSAIRHVASRFLLFVVRHSPAVSRSWASAMQREMEFVDGDWDAVLWALGCTTAICRHAAMQQMRHSREVLAERPFARSVTSVMVGVAGAFLVLTLSVVVLSSLLHASWIDASQEKLAQRWFVVGIPEGVYALSAIMLWRPHRYIASGILATGAILVAHAVVHIVTSG